MAFLNGLTTGLRALTAARLGLETAGHNVANAATPGHSRRQTLLGTTMPFALGRLELGTGVRVDAVRRVLDEHVERGLLLQAAHTGFALLEGERHAEIEAVLGSGSDKGAPALLADLFASFTRAAALPADRAHRAGAVHAGRTLAGELRSVAARLADLGGSAFAEARSVVAEINRLAEGIARLNEAVFPSEAAGAQANDLRDRRDRLIRALAGHVPVRTQERANGHVDVLLDGHMLVAGEKAFPLVAAAGPEGSLEVLVGAEGERLRPAGGRLGGLLAAAEQWVPRFAAEADRLAHNLILQTNRLHATGIPASGPLRSLVSEYAVEGPGDPRDRLLSAASLPFPVRKGELYVAATREATGEMVRTRIAVDPQTTTLGELADALSANPGIEALVDPSGRLRIAAKAGWGFDFSTRLDGRPDAFGSFGGPHASVGGLAAGPFALSVPATFTVEVDGGPAQTVALQAAHFQDPTAATAAEVAAALNAQLQGATARDVGGRLVLRSDSLGAGSSLRVDDVAGGALAAMGVAQGTTFAGSETGVEVSVVGQWKGEGNDRLWFRALGSGTIGVTPGLQVEVLDGAGKRVAVLDVGQGYNSDDVLEVAGGVSVAFGPGEISADAGHQFALDLLAESDTSDVLVALGLNVFFTGSSASDIRVAAALEADPDRLATSLTLLATDGGNLRRLAGLSEQGLEELSGASLSRFAEGLLLEAGFATQRARELADAQSGMLDALKARREQVSGVSLEEEMVEMVRYQQAFEAASRYIATLSDLTRTLLEMAR